MPVFTFKFWFQYVYNYCTLCTYIDIFLYIYVHIFDYSYVETVLINCIEFWYTYKPDFWYRYTNTLSLSLSLIFFINL